MVRLLRRASSRNAFPSCFRFHLSWYGRVLSFPPSLSFLVVSRRSARLIYRLEDSTHAILPHYIQPFDKVASSSLPPPLQGTNTSTMDRKGHHPDHLTSSTSFSSPASEKAEGVRTKKTPCWSAEESVATSSESTNTPSSPAHPLVFPPWPADSLEWNTGMGADGGHSLRLTFSFSSSLEPKENGERNQQAMHGQPERSIRHGTSGVITAACHPSSSMGTVNRLMLSSTEVTRLEMAEAVYRSWCQWWSARTSSSVCATLSCSSASSAYPKQKDRDTHTADAEHHVKNDKEHPQAHSSASLVTTKEVATSCDLPFSDEGWLCERCLRVTVGPNFATAVREELGALQEARSSSSLSTPSSPRRQEEDVRERETQRAITGGEEKTGHRITEKAGGESHRKVVLPPCFLPAFHASSPHVSLPKIAGKPSPLVSNVASISCFPPTLQGICVEDVGTRTICVHCHTPRLDRVRRAYACILKPSLFHSRRRPATSAATTQSASAFPSWWMCGTCLEYNPARPSPVEKEGLSDIVCRCCGAQVRAPHHFFPFPTSSLPASTRPTRPVSSPVQEKEEVEEERHTLGNDKGTKERKTALDPLPEYMREARSDFSLSFSSVHDTEKDLMRRPVHSIFNIRDKVMKWRCGLCQEVTSLQSPYCRYCHAERFRIIIACPRCATQRMLSNALVYGGALTSATHSSSESSCSSSSSSPSSFPWFGPHSCFSPLAASIRCERCHDVLHGGDVVGCGRNEPEVKGTVRNQEASKGDASLIKTSPPISLVYHKPGNGGEGWWCACGFVSPPLVSSCLRCRLPRWLPPLQREDVVTKYWDREGCSHWWCEGCQTINAASVKLVMMKKVYHKGASPLQKTEKAEVLEGGEEGRPKMEGATHHLPSSAPPSYSMVKGTSTQHGNVQCVCCKSPWHCELLQEDVVSTAPNGKGVGRRHRHRGGEDEDHSHATPGFSQKGRREEEKTSAGGSHSSDAGLDEEVLPSSLSSPPPLTCWWRCACHHVNRRWNTLCASCDLPAQQNGITADVLSFWAKGDWICEACHRHNYKLRVVCSCGAKRAMFS